MTSREAAHEPTVEAADVAAMLASYFSPDQLAELLAGAGALQLARMASGRGPGVWQDFAGVVERVLVDVDLDAAAAELGDPGNLPIAVPPLALVRTSTDRGVHGAAFGRIVLVFDRGQPGPDQAARLWANQQRLGAPVTVQLADGSTDTLIPARTGFVLGGVAELAQRLWVTPEAT